MTKLEHVAGERSNCAGATGTAQGMHSYLYELESPIGRERLWYGCGCLGVHNEEGDVVGVLTTCPHETVAACFREGAERPECTHDVRMSLRHHPRGEPLFDQRGGVVEGWDLQRLSRILRADPAARSVAITELRGRGYLVWGRTVVRVVAAALLIALSAALFPVLFYFLPFVMLVPLIICVLLLGAMVVTDATGEKRERRAKRRLRVLPEDEEAPRGRSLGHLTLAPPRARIELDWEDEPPCDSDVFMRSDTEEEEHQAGAG